MLSESGWRANRRLLAVAAIVVTSLAIAVVVIIARARAATEAREILYADGTQIIFLNGTCALPAKSFPQNRTIELRGNGKVFIKAFEQPEPLIVHTGLMILTVDGDSALRATVSSERIGEQVEVLYGHVQAAKAYASPYNTPDMLVGGEMSMVNLSIDLMEKETFDRTELIQWSNAVLATAARHRVGAD
jgi:ferric-dicitrate binding protein FerR (iron transport regulator)